MLKRLHSKRGEGYIDVAVLVLCVMLVIAVAVSVLPVFVTKNKLDTYASELCRQNPTQRGIYSDGDYTGGYRSVRRIREFSCHSPGSCQRKK